MTTRTLPRIPSAEITPEPLYLDRRQFIGAAAVAGTAAVAGILVPPLLRRAGPGVGGGDAPRPDVPTPYDDVTGYNNFYEFGSGKGDPAANAGSLRTTPWTVRVDGEVERPASYAVDDVAPPSAAEERVYRLRCVEGWSMVIPWLGVPLASVLRRVRPTPRARWVEFTTLNDPRQMPGQRTNVLPWPYVEALRLDEALHPLTFLATGLYGRALPNQNGAPLRLVVPWKYGFKSGKSLVRIRLTRERPLTTWHRAAPTEYGFWANVNPTVDHPRWSQARERRVGEWRRRPTLMFNGYADQVASLYAGMDLRRDY